MTDFLLELRSEEIPARMQDRAREDLARLFAAELAKAGLAARETITYATPRRLTLIARDLPAETAAVSEETKGPKASAPPQALDGFLRKTGLTRAQLVERDGVLFAVIERAGRATSDVLAEAIPAIVRAFPWPKAMRWGEASLTMAAPRWVRPLTGIVALFGEDVVPCEVAGVVSGAATVGHRFHHPGVITIGSADDYVEKLRACHVIVDQAERRQIIALGATMAARKAGLELVRDEGLLTENAGLTEWPVPLLGRFDAAFLSVPPEVIQLTARVNQKYFVCRQLSPLPLAGGAGGGQFESEQSLVPSPNPSRKREGDLANAFVCTANIDAHDGGGKIVEGNRKVLAARLSDAKFFYDTDLKVPLAEQAQKLDRIVFHEKLGTVADKVERVAKLARWLVEEGIVKPVAPAQAEASAISGDGGAPNAAAPACAGATDVATLAAQAERAARLCKADLVTLMVGEFPELQGVMGGYYAAAQGEDDAVADAIRDHYKPVGQGDDVPTAPVTVAVSLADKLDTIFQFFSIEQMPTGSKDPFALRRAMLGIVAIIFDNRLRIGLIRLCDAFDPPFDRNFVHPANAFIGFAIDRLKVQQREAGVRHDLIDAVFALGGEDDLVRLLARVRALQAFVGTPDGANLLAGYKRAANILKKENFVAPAEAGASPLQGDDVAPNPAAPAFAGATGGLSYTPESAERALIAALDAAEPAAAAAVAAEDFAAAMAALATLRAPIDTFFESVIVNDPEQDKRLARLALLERVRAAVHNVADFSKIEG